MKHEYDELMRQALAPKEAPGDRLNQKVLSMAKEKEKMSKKMSYTGRRKYQAAAVAAVLTLAVGTVTGVAAWRLLTPDQVAESVEDKGLAAAFTGKDAVQINETQTYGDYSVSLLGIVSEKNLSQYVTEDDMTLLDNDKTYSVVAIERTDGTAMPDTSDDAYGENPFFVSPLIQGYNPAQYNIMSMSGSYVEMVEDGIQYRLSECDNIEMFADHDMYLCVSSGTFYDENAYHYDAQSGTITRNETYTGVNALFSLPMDRKLADQKAAAAYIKSIDQAATETTTEAGIAALSDEEDKQKAEEIEAFMEKLTPENIDEYAVPLESTIQTVTPDADGNVKATYQLEDGTGGTVGGCVDVLFEGVTEGMSPAFGYSVGDYDLHDLTINTYTLNADGTVTFAIYVPR